MNYEEQAIALYAAGELKITKKKRFSRTFDYDGAIEDFEKAANFFKMCSNFSRASAAFQQVADIQLKLGKPQLAVNPLQNALNCANKCENSARTNELVTKLIEVCMLSNRFLQAGKTTKELAEKAEQKGDYDNAESLYKRAVEILSSESNTAAEIRGCRLKQAEIMATYQGRYAEASTIFEQIAIECLNIRLLQFHVRDYFLNAWLCLVAKDVTAIDDIQRAADRYGRLDPAMPDSANYEFITGAIDPLKNSDSDAFYSYAAAFFKRTGKGREALLKKLCNEIMDRLDENNEDEEEEFVAGDDEEVLKAEQTRKETKQETPFTNIINEVSVKKEPLPEDDDDLL